ncbi:MAG: SDR family NAD(P)-dependent oxidoreductase [Caldilineaceae bacterium]
MEKIAIITGGNRGLGYETAKALATDPAWAVMLACRDITAGIAAARQIKQTTGNGHIIPRYLNLASLASVRKFAADVAAANLPPIATLICNAGVSKTTVQERSIDGYEMTFAVNHLGHFLLTQLLLSQLTPPARILVVSSGLHDADQVAGPMQPPRYVNAELAAHPDRDPDRPADDADAGGQAYSTSKLCNMLFTLELARQLEAAGIEGITVNALNPGLMAGTGLGREGKGFTRFAWYYILPLLRPLMGNMARTAADSGKDLAYLATAPELADTTATYFDGRTPAEPANAVQDRAVAAELWHSSICLTRLQPQETILPIGAIV